MSTEEHPQSSNFWLELGKLVFISLVIVIPFRLYVAKPFIVEGASMDPTFESGEYLIVDELTYHWKDPERGSVLIFRYPRDPSKYFIKRVIGLPGETLEIKKGIVTIKNDANPLGMTLEEPYVKYPRSDNLSVTLDDNEFFVMGDNRLGSADSRLWGPVSRKEVVGRPIIRFVPPALFPGNAIVSENK